MRNHIECQAIKSIQNFYSGSWVKDCHVPSYEKRFIQECKNEKAKKAMVDAMSRGDIRIIFGSTSMLGTGVNAQQRVVAIHHLDTPWVRHEIA